MRRTFIFLVVLLASLAEGQAGAGQSQSATLAETPSEASVRRILQQMLQGGGMSGIAPAFPKQLSWGDIPALMKHIHSKARLQTLLVNPISSFHQRSCTEGMMALWLVEGIRKGNKFASLNPLCLPKQAGVADREIVSEEQHKSVTAAYEAWWKRVSGLPKEKACLIDPLKDSGLSWYGSNIPS